MGIVKAKSAKEINEEIKSKRNPAADGAGDPEPKEQDAPVRDENTSDAGAAESPEEENQESADNDGASDSPEEAPAAEEPKE